MRELLFLVLTLLLAAWVLPLIGVAIRSIAGLLLSSGGEHPFLFKLFYRIEVRKDFYPLRPGELVPYNVYRPMAREVAPALIIYHGATPYGEDHEGVDRLARAMAHIGLLVFVPRLPALKEVIIDERSLEAMTSAYRHFQGHARVTPAHLGVIGTSFAGGLLLKALLSPAMREPPPRSVLIYGSYCDLEASLRFILSGGTDPAGSEEPPGTPDPWGQIIFFHNFLDELPRTFDRVAVRQVLDHYIRADKDKGGVAAEKLAPRERRILKLIITPDNPESARLAEKTLLKARPRLQALSPANFYHEVDFPFWVMHGKGDRLVPYTEALALKALMPRQVRLAIAADSGHRGVETGRGWRSTLKELMVMATFLGRFLHNLER